MAGMNVNNEQPRKRAKTVDISRIRGHLIKFIDKINDATSFIKTQFASYNFCFVKILGCNAAYPTNFTRVWCETVRSSEDKDKEKRRIVLFGDLFEIDCVQEFVSPSDVCSKVFCPGQLMAFDRLADFLDSLNETESIMERVLQRGDISKASWASVLGTHVLRKLSISQQMTVNINKCLEKKSVCACGCNTPVVLGDTSIGHEDVWHGSVDIIIGAIAVVVVVSSDDRGGGDIGDADESSLEKQSAFDLGTGNLELLRHQLLAGTIVFSHLQNCGLVPLVAISKDKVKILMYEPATDLLYESTELQFFYYTEDNRLYINIDAIVALWMAINYVHFCSGSRASHVDFGYTSNFKAFIEKPPVSNIYETQMRLGGCTQGQRTKSNYSGVSSDVKLLRP